LTCKIGSVWRHDTTASNEHLGGGKTKNPLPGHANTKPHSIARR
jgi:hypothetical protein